MNKLHIFIVFCLIAFTAFSQKNISTKIFDSKNGQALELVTVRLFKVVDSSFVQGNQTNAEGECTLNKIPVGKYKLKASLMGYKEHVQIISMQQQDISIQNIQLIEDSKVLKEVEVKGTVARVVVRNDTLEFNAAAVKTTQNAVAEDVLKRLPGVVISADGKITINGDEIKKVRVNGKKFFGDDIEMATKNIPADLIDKIQVLEQKSEMAQLTGVDDGESERIINITFKPEKSKGAFGNVIGGLGMDINTKARYDESLFLNMIDGDAQTAITGGANNTNTSRSNKGRSVSTNNSGITSTQNIGINNNTTVNSKIKIGGDGSFNYTNNDTKTESNKTSYIKDAKYYNNTSTQTLSDSYSGNMRFEMEWKMDSLNTLILQPNIDYNLTNSVSNQNFKFLSDTITTSTGSTKNVKNTTTVNGGFSATYSHKFPSKKGRIFTTNLQSSFSENDNLTDNISDKLYNQTSTTTIINQRSTTAGSKYNIGVRMSFVEPMWNNHHLLETTLAIRNTKNTSDKQQFGIDSIGNYSIKNIDYCSNYENNFFKETMELNYRYLIKKYDITLGIKAEPSQSYSFMKYDNGEIRNLDKNVFNFAPNAKLQFSMSKKRYARIDYRGETEQPSVNQLQPVKNNSNPMIETVGNASLKPSFGNRIRMIYSNFNDSTFASFNAFANIKINKDALVLNSIYDSSGKQYNQTINTSEIPYNFSGSLLYNTPLFAKKLHFNSNTFGNIDQQYGYSAKGMNVVDPNILIPIGNLSSTNRYGLGENIGLNYSNDMGEIGTKAGVKYTSTSNNLNPGNTITTDWSVGGNLVLNLPHSISIGTDCNFTSLKGYSAFDQNELIWNASIDKSLFNNKGALSLKLYDILHQRLSIRQTIGDNYIQVNSYNTLSSYFIISFSYKINKYSSSKKPIEPNGEFRQFNPGENSPHNDRRRPMEGM